MKSMIAITAACLLFSGVLTAHTVTLDTLPPSLSIAPGTPTESEAGSLRISGTVSEDGCSVVLSGVGLAFYPIDSFIVFPLMVLGGAVGGWTWAMIPALLKVRFGTNEILVSLMLVYVAEQLLASMSLGLRGTVGRGAQVMPIGHVQQRNRAAFHDSAFSDGS